MITPYLIQRAKFIKEDEYSANRKGIDKLLGFDYMGSAELIMILCFGNLTLNLMM